MTIVDDGFGLALHLTCNVSTTIYIVLGGWRGIIHLINSDVCISFHIGRGCDIRAIESSESATIYITAICSIAKSTAVECYGGVAIGYCRLCTTIDVTLHGWVTRTGDVCIAVDDAEERCVLRGME